MIHSTSNNSGQPRSDAIATSDRKPAALPSTAYAATGETLSSAGADSLRAALAATPEIRPEVVARGKELASDVNYPPRAIIEDLAKLFQETQDLSLEA